MLKIEIKVFKSESKMMKKSVMEGSKGATVQHSVQYFYNLYILCTVIVQITCPSEEEVHMMDMYHSFFDCVNLILRFV